MDSQVFDLDEDDVSVRNKEPVKAVLGVGTEAYAVLGDLDISKRQEARIRYGQWMDSDTLGRMRLADLQALKVALRHVPSPPPADLPYWTISPEGLPAGLALSSAYSSERQATEVASETLFGEATALGIRPDGDWQAFVGGARELLSIRRGILSTCRAVASMFEVGWGCAPTISQAAAFLRAYPALIAAGTESLSSKFRGKLPTSDSLAELFQLGHNINLASGAFVEEFGFRPAEFGRDTLQGLERGITKAKGGDVVRAARMLGVQIRSESSARRFIDLMQHYLGQLDRLDESAKGILGAAIDHRDLLRLAMLAADVAPTRNARVEFLAGLDIGALSLLLPSGELHSIERAERILVRNAAAVEEPVSLARLVAALEKTEDGIKCWLDRIDALTDGKVFQTVDEFVVYCRSRQVSVRSDVLGVTVADDAEATALDGYIEWLLQVCALPVPDNVVEFLWKEKGGPLAVGDVGQSELPVDKELRENVPLEIETSDSPSADVDWTSLAVSCLANIANLHISSPISDQPEILRDAPRVFFRLQDGMNESQLWKRLESIRKRAEEVAETTRIETLHDLRRTLFRVDDLSRGRPRFSDHDEWSFEEAVREAVLAGMRRLRDTSIDPERLQNIVEAARSLSYQFSEDLHLKMSPSDNPTPGVEHAPTAVAFLAYALRKEKMPIETLMATIPVEGRGRAGVAIDDLVRACPEMLILAFNLFPDKAV